MYTSYALIARKIHARVFPLRHAGTDPLHTSRASRADHPGCYDVWDGRHRDLSSEGVESLVERYIAPFLDCIHEYSGDITETSGEGLMMLFQDARAFKHTEAIEIYRVIQLKEASSSVG